MNRVGQGKNTNEILVDLDGEYIELFKLLKVANMVQSGGEAKFAIADRFVRVNGVLETRKRKKMRKGDYAEFNGQVVRIKPSGN